MSTILETFRRDCARHHRHRSGCCASARRGAYYALLERYKPETVMRHWLTVVRILDRAERGAGHEP